MNAPPPVAAGPAVTDTQAALAASVTKQFITFTLGAQEYGIDIMRVREIKGWTEGTSLPHAPAYVRGVVNLRGVIVPILDLRARFGMGTTTTTPMHVVVIVATETSLTGLLVDAVSDIISIEQGDIRPVPDFGPAQEESVLEGVYAQDDRLVTLVSLDGLIGPELARADRARAH